MAQSDFQDMKNALSRALGARATDAGAPLLAPVWREAVGALAEHSRPVSLSRGVLQIEASPDFLFDLGRQRELLVGRLNARLGRGTVRAIEFVPAR